MTIYKLLETLWQDFSELNVFEQVTVVSGWIGVPSLVAYLVNLTRGVGSKKDWRVTVRKHLSSLSSWPT